MSKGHICVTVTWEPASFHQATATQRCVSVHLAFDAEKSDVTKLLKKADWIFNPYRIDNGKAKKATDITIKSIVAKPEIDGQTLSEWLDERGGFAGRSAPQAGRVVNPEEALACDLLLGSSSWDAPVAHAAQLMRILYLTADPDPTEPLCILPIDDAEIPDVVHSGNDVSVELKSGELVDFKIVTTVVPWDGAPNLPKDLKEASDPKAFPVPVRPDGFLFAVRAEIDFRLLQAFESAATSLYWSLPALLDVDESLLQTLKPTNLVRLGVALALDPLWMSLLSPGAANREGTLLAPLARLFEKTPPGQPFTWLREQIKKIELTHLLGAPDGDIHLSLLGDLIPSFDKDKFDTAVQALRAFLANIQQETGLETVLARLLDHVIRSTPGQDKVHALLADYKRLLTGSFNALEAARYDCSHLLTLWLTQQKTADNKFSAILTASDPYGQRLNKGAKSNEWSKVFGGSWITLEDKFDDSSGRLTQAWKSALGRSLGIDTEPSLIRFVPDRSPQPIPIPIATTATGEKLGDFTERFNGVGVLLRRGSETAWSHANLVAVRPLEKKQAKLEYPDAEWGPGKFTVKPVLPVAVDERREMFLRFHGIPLASPAYGATGAPGIAPSDPNAIRRSFYIQRDALLEEQDDSGKKFAKPPRLAYGDSYASCAFSVSKGGSLPFDLQGLLPWKAKPEVNLPDTVLKDIVTKVEYKRRTALGAVTLESPSSTATRIGAQYDNVYPLAQDFPRVTVSTVAGQTDTLDLFRRTDGIGSLLAPTKGVGTTWPISGQQFASGSQVTKATLTIEIHGDANVNLDSKELGKKVLKDKELEDFLKHDWTIEILSKGEIPTQPAPDHVLQIPLEIAPVGSTLWVRLKFTTTSKGTWSFASPESTRGENRGRQGAPHSPILLIGNATGNVWDSRFTSEVRLNSALSRITWLDWERWFNNSTLEINGRIEPKEAKEAERALVDVSILRGEDSSGVLSLLLDRLPDPAISGFLVELAPIDRIVPSTTEWEPLQTIVEAPDWLKNVTPPPSPKSEEEYKTYVARLSKYLSDIDKYFRMTCKVSCGLPALEMNGTEVTVRVPSGSVAKLTVRPLLKDTLVNKASAPFANEMAQLAVGTYTWNKVKCLLFPGAELLIEAMYLATWDEEENKNLLNHVLSIECARDSRSYRIIQEDPSRSEIPLARLFANIEIRTQRWRPSGRPIYRWLRPKEHCLSDPKIANVAMELKHHNEKVAEFEAQLFFDRDDADSDVTRARLLGKGTQLSTVSWEKPSATYFRHGFSLITRYAGALRPGQRDSVWPPHVPEWSRSCAILGATERLDITRPQIRCLIPLSQDTSSSSAGGKVVEPQYPRLTSSPPSPPLACVLDEPPYSVGGLADRIVAELLTGVGYGFEANVEAVQPIDTGKEISRDPRLDTRSWKYDNSVEQLDPSYTFVLETEGPIGLHFEQSGVTAHAWTNCQYLLRPATLEGASLPDESFLGVRMRRILDSDWVIDPPEGRKLASENLSLEAGYQATIKLKPQDGQIDLMTLRVDGGDTHKVLHCVVKGGRAVLKFNRQFVAKNYKQGDVVLCMLPYLDSIEELRLLHTSYADGRYTLSVLALTVADWNKASIARGRSNYPMLLASLDWKSDLTPELTDKPIHLSFLKESQVSRLAASSSTFREWGRTAKNSEWVHGFIDSRCEPVAVRDLIASKAIKPKLSSLSFAKSKSQSVWPVSALADSRQPLCIQRHLVAVFTKRSGGLGKQFDLYCGATLLNGKDPLVATELAQDAAKVEFHELEIPAVIVAGGSPLSEFETAHLDLIATGGVSRGGELRANRLHIRFANSAASMAASQGLKVVLRKVDKENASTKLDELTCPARVRAVDVHLEHQKTIQFRFHLSTGEIGPWTKSTAAAPELLEAPGFAVGFVVPSTLPEVWADVSLLHSVGGSEPNDQFDFDWLFSLEADQPTPATRMLPAVLSKLHEAQARLVSSSIALELSAK